MARDIDKEKKCQRKAEVAALREVRKQQVLQTVLRAKDLNEAAQHLDTTCDELKKRILSYGVIRNYRELWSHAVKDYFDAGQPHQYEMPVSSFSEFVDKPRYLNFEEKNLQFELLLEEKLQEGIAEGKTEVTVPHPVLPNREIKYDLEVPSKFDPLP